MANVIASVTAGSADAAWMGRIVTAQCACGSHLKMPCGLLVPKPTGRYRAISGDKYWIW